MEQKIAEILCAIGALLLCPRLLEIGTGKTLEEIDKWSRDLAQAMRDRSTPSNFQRLGNAIAPVMLWVGIAVGSLGLIGIIFLTPIFIFLQWFGVETIAGFSTVELSRWSFWLSLGIVILSGCLVGVFIHLKERLGKTLKQEAIGRFRAMTRGTLGLVLLSGSMALFYWFFRENWALIGKVGIFGKIEIGLFVLMITPLVWRVLLYKIPIRLGFFTPEEVRENQGIITIFILYFSQFAIALSVAILVGLAFLFTWLFQKPFGALLTICATKTTKDVLLIAGALLLSIGTLLYVVAG